MTLFEQNLQTLVNAYSAITDIEYCLEIDDNGYSVLDTLSGKYIAYNCNDLNWLTQKIFRLLEMAINSDN